MNATQIIKYLPKLSKSERQKIFDALIRIHGELEDVAVCNKSALEGALLMDKLEKSKVGRSKRKNVDTRSWPDFYARLGAIFPTQISKSAAKKFDKAIRGE
jgi:hypothetical protein